MLSLFLPKITVDAKTVPVFFLLFFFVSFSSTFSASHLPVSTSPELGGVVLVKTLKLLKVPVQ